MAAIGKKSSPRKLVHLFGAWIPMKFCPWLPDATGPQTSPPKKNSLREKCYINSQKTESVGEESKFPSGMWVRSEIGGLRKVSEYRLRWWTDSLKKTCFGTPVLGISKTLHAPDLVQSATVQHLFVNSPLSSMAEISWTSPENIG